MSQETKKCWLKRIPWMKRVDSIVGYAIYGGAVALAVIVGLIVCCL